MNKKIDYANMFFISVIIIGSIVLAILILNLCVKNKRHNDVSTTTTTTEVKKTNNVGVYRSFYNPAYVGDKVLASFYDEIHNTYTNVDIEGVRFMDEEEASSYASQELKDGFSWFGFEYVIYFNDLTYLNESIKPDIETGIYNVEGYNFVTFNGHNYQIEVNSIVENNIKNGEKTTVKAIYQYPRGKEHEICFGQKSKILSCFTK